MSGFGETVAPRIDAVSVNGAAASEVRRASTVTSQTPACGFETVRLKGLPVPQPAGARCSSSPPRCCRSDAVRVPAQEPDWPVPGVARGPARSTLKAGVPAGTLKKYALAVPGRASRSW